MQRAAAIIGSAIFLVIAPGTLAVYVPWYLTHWHFAPPLFLIARVLGAALIVAGLPILLDSFARFALQGLGTPAPVMPPKRLVVTGFYRYVRNPMYVAVTALIAGPRYKVNCNAAVIMTNDGVIVVDSHSKPSAARALYQEIQSLTKQPIKKIINTHFHWDHWQGNEVYAGANPGVEVVATERTKENLMRPDAGVGGVAYIQKQIDAMPGEIAKLKDDIQKESDPAKKRNLESNLQQAEEFLKELQAMKPALPTRTVSTTTTLREGGREIQLHVLGRAHTNGDLFIYLPREKVVATGDALIDWMPFMNDGYPGEWPDTLVALGKLGFEHIIPGHGEVRPKTHLTFFRDYFVDLIAAVKKASADGASLDEMKTKIGDQLASKYEAGFSKYPLGRYRDRVGSNVEAVYTKVVRQA